MSRRQQRFGVYELLEQLGLIGVCQKYKSPTHHQSESLDYVFILYFLQTVTKCNPLEKKKMKYYNYKK